MARCAPCRARAHRRACRTGRVASFFSRKLYYLVDDAGRRVGTISRNHALHHPVYQVHINGFDRVQLRREIRIDGEGISVDGNLMGDDFTILRHGSKLAAVRVRPAHNRVPYGIDAFSQAGEVFAPRSNLDDERTI